MPTNPATNAPTLAVPATWTTGPTFQINNIKLYFPVVFISIIDNFKFSENMKQGFKWTISCNKYRSEITTQLINSNLDYMIDFKNGVNGPARNSFNEF